ncbi:dihydroorotase family protein [Candidatus Woesearchaeota archaeon]|nr:dihydroorotase family protein [Candidatus Woesearchaeota archaeon]
MLVVKNAKLIVQGKPVLRHILIENGKIHNIVKSLPDKKIRIVDAQKNFVIPGMIDCHVHLRDMNLFHKEDFLTGTKAAAAGGVTTVLDMPNSDPQTITLHALAQKRIVAKKAIVNYGFHFGCTPESDHHELKKVKNIASTKVYMNASTGNMGIEDTTLIKIIFENSRMLSVHAESEKVPVALSLAKKTKKRVYLCHLSLQEEVEYVRTYKKKYPQQEVFAEVCPHHLFLTEKDVQHLKGLGMMKPSLKTKQDQDALWKGIYDGTIDTIGSDHAPHTLSEKNDIACCPFGVPGLETTLPLLLDAVNQGKISLTHVVQLTSRNPAKIFGIKNKGYLKPRYDADIVILDMQKKKRIENKKLYTKCKWSPFAGKTLQGWPILTLVKGKIIYQDGLLFETPAEEIHYDQL